MQSKPDDSILETWLNAALGLKAGESAFPWQKELLERLGGGDIPSALDFPTGLGKTSAMALWLVARAQGAPLPRRLVYIVDRRAVVDQATEAAVELREAVEALPDFKRALGLEMGMLPISTLRGRHADNKAWLEDPASPAVIVGTVDKIGSALLFEGYGVSRKMRPYHAGLLGADTLVLLDEAHLVPSFESLLKAVADGRKNFGPQAGIAGAALIPSFKLMTLSATGRDSEAAPFGLTPQDLEQADKPGTVLGKRLRAEKLLQVKQLDDGANLVEEAANEAWAISEKGSKPLRCVLFFDKREDAEKAKKVMERLGSEETALFVGARRMFEREQDERWLREHGFLAGTPVPLKKPAFLFATSAAEVGVDLDAEHMVCDLVAWERMVQRLGRVNRRGEGKARVIVVREARPEPKDKEAKALGKVEKSENGESPWKKGKEEEGDRQTAKSFQAKVQQWESRLGPIEKLPKPGEFYDASPDALRRLKEDAASKDVLRKATTPPPLHPALSRALVDAWAMTSLREHPGRPEVGPWLRGWVQDPPQTSVVWRKHLPVRRSGTVTPKEVEAFFEAAPWHVSEILETETFRVAKWMEERAARLGRLDAERQGMDVRDTVAFILTPAGELKKALKLADVPSRESEPSQHKQWEKDLAGALLVLDARLGGLDSGMFDFGSDAVPRTLDGEQEWPQAYDVGFRIRSIQGGADEDVSETGWRERWRFQTSESDDHPACLVIEKRAQETTTEEDRSVAKLESLKRHVCAVEARARVLAKKLGLPEPYEKMLALAARLHDEGKRVDRWQRAFRAPKDEGAPYAKTPGPVSYALLDGYRHELGSLVYAEKDGEWGGLSDDLKDLVLHLIAAHHGFARPVIATEGAEEPPSRMKERERDIALRFARLQRQWGPWGLAWWEALVRAADQQASRAVQETGTDSSIEKVQA